MKPGIMDMAIAAAFVLLPENASVKLVVLPCPICMKPRMMMRANAANFTTRRALRVLAVHFTVMELTVAQVSGYSKLYHLYK